ncbi:WPP domain-interacting protein 2-like [Aristolochia californica]|uniref:WPP domain-interacting protein 2-like n=1 Tax=Aristolochia californica TaxID=171875 RepID=UPI0035E0A139
MENAIDSVGKKVGTDVDPVEKSSPSVESRSETNGASVGGDGRLGSDELGKIESGERSFDSDEMRKDLNGVLFNKIVDSVDVEPALEKAHDFDRTKVGINGSCSLVGTFSQENKTSAGINWGRAGNGKMLEGGNGGIRSPSEISEELILGTLDDSNLYEEEMESQPQEKTRISEEIKLESNGSPPHELEKENEKGTGIGKAAETSPKGAESPSGDSSLSPTTKGYGLKKWRRKRRDAVKDAGSTVDPNRILKRGLSNAAEPVKGVLTSGKILGKSEGSVASMTSVIKNLGFSSLPLGVSDSESRLAKGSTFPIGTDSENSEDRSSKSSTATSIAKLLAEVPIVMGIAKDKNKAKNPSGRMSANAVQRGQQGKGKVEASKKLRGERAKTDNENSYSSVESDLRSSAFVFTQTSSFAEASDEIERERSLNYDGENSDEGQAYEPQSSEEVRTGNFEEKGEDHGDVSKEEPVVNARGEKKLENRDSFPTEKDPLVESMFLLQAAQEALEKEIRKFGEIGKESISSADVASHGINLAGKFATFETGTPAPNSSDQLHFEEMEECSSTPLETRMKELTQRINILECSLEETRLSLKAKESKVFELESILSGSQMPKDERDTKVECLKETCKEMENELENMLMKKIEAELEYLTLSGINQKWRAAVEDHIDLFEDQKTVAKERAEMMRKLSDTRQKAILLEEEAKELEASSRELVRLKELSARNNLCKSALFCFTQFVLICVVIGWFLLELLPPPPDFVPT